MLGLAGLAGVTAAGAALARSERRRRAYTADEVSARLRARHEERSRVPDSVAGVSRDSPVTTTEPARPAQAARGVDAAPEAATTTTLDDAVDVARTGDLWLFRGRSMADQAIRVVTNAPVNHVGMAVVLEDLPPLIWHAELGRSLRDMWSGDTHRGAQLHDLRDAVVTWATRYGQRVWVRQLHADIGRDDEDALLLEIARTDGTPFPRTAALAGRWVRGRLRRPASVEVTYCAEVVAGAYRALGLIGPDRPTNWYDPGRFWSGDELELLRGAQLGSEVRIEVSGETGLTT